MLAIKVNSTVYDLPVQTEKAQALLDEWYAAGVMTELAAIEAPQGFDEYPVLPQIPRPQPKIGMLYYPVFGATRYAFATVLCDYYTLGLIRADLDAQSQSIGQTRVVLQFRDDPDDPAEVPREFTMYLVAARPVSQTTTDDPPALEPTEDDAYILTLVDVRWYWQFAQGSRSVEGKPDTWEQLFDDLGSVLGVPFVFVETVPSAYLTPTDRWAVERNVGRPTNYLLDAAAAAVGARVVVDTVGHVFVQRPTSTIRDQAVNFHATQITDERNLSGGLLPATETLRAVPAVATAVFYDHRGSCGTNTASVSTALSGLGLTAYTGIAGIPSRQAVGWLDIQANAVDSVRFAAATQFATDWYAWQDVPLDATYVGFPTIVLSAFIDHFELVHTADKGITRAARPPVNYPQLWGGTWVCNDNAVDDGDGITTGTPSSCAAFLGYDDTTCFTLSFPGVTGRCSCIDTTQTTELSWDAGSGGWLSADTIDLCGGKTGYALLKVDDTTCCSPTLTLQISPDKVLFKDSCTLQSDGTLSGFFNGSGTGICTFMTTRDCAFCPDGTAYKWTFTLTGFSTTCTGLHNTPYTLHNYGSCVWTDDASKLLLTVDEGTGDILLTFDDYPGLVYTGTWDCTDSTIVLTLSTDGGCTDADATITLTRDESKLPGCSEEYYTISVACTDCSQITTLCGSGQPVPRYICVTVSGYTSPYPFVAQDPVTGLYDGRTFTATWDGSQYVGHVLVSNAQVAGSFNETYAGAPGAYPYDGCSQRYRVPSGGWTPIRMPFYLRCNVVDGVYQWEVAWGQAFPTADPITTNSGGLGYVLDSGVTYTPFGMTLSPGVGYDLVVTSGSCPVQGCNPEDPGFTANPNLNGPNTVQGAIANGDAALLEVQNSGSNNGTYTSTWVVSGTVKEVSFTLADGHELHLISDRSVTPVGWLFWANYLGAETTCTYAGGPTLVSTSTYFEAIGAFGLGTTLNDVRVTTACDPFSPPPPPPPPPPSGPPPPPSGCCPTPPLGKSTLYVRFFNQTGTCSGSTTCFPGLGVIPVTWNPGVGEYQYTFTAPACMGYSGSGTGTVHVSLVCEPTTHKYILLVTTDFSDPGTCCVNGFANLLVPTDCNPFLIQGTLPIGSTDAVVCTNPAALCCTGTVDFSISEIP